MVRDGKILWDQSILWAEFIQDRALILEQIIKQEVRVVNIKINTIDSTFESAAREIIKFKNLYKDHDKISFNYKPQETEKVYVSFSLADSSIIQNIETDFDIFEALGVTSTVLCAERNRVGDSCWEPTDVGLSMYGKEFVTMSNQKKIILDGSLSGYKTSMEAMALSTKPFIFSHSNPNGVCQNSRNLRDDQIISCAKTGGVIGITSLGGYLGEAIPSPEIVFENIDYITSLVGDQHIGIGSNFLLKPDMFWHAMKVVEQPGEIGKGTCFSWQDIYQVVDLMIKHGYSQRSIDNILGLNWKRIFINGA